MTREEAMRRSPFEHLASLASITLLWVAVLSITPASAATNTQVKDGSADAVWQTSDACSHSFTELDAQQTMTLTQGGPAMPMVVLSSFFVNRCTGYFLEVHGIATSGVTVSIPRSASSATVTGIIPAHVCEGAVCG